VSIIKCEAKRFKSKLLKSVSAESESELNFISLNATK